jgi:Glycosyltransferase family 87
VNVSNSAFSSRAPSELTPAQHAAIRRQLAMIPVYIWLVYSWVHVLVRIPYAEPPRDFVHFYVQGVIALEKDAGALYDIDRMADIAQRVLPGGQRPMYPPVYGPQMALLFTPLAALPYVVAQNVWVAVTILVYAACVYAIWRVCPRLRDQPGTTLVLAAAAPPLHFVLGFVQVSVLGLACATVAFLALRADRPFLAGLAIGSLVYKPPLGIVAAFVFGLTAIWPAQSKLARDGIERRLVAGAAMAIAVQLGVGALYWGPSILPEYIGALTRLPRFTTAMEPNKFHMHSWRAFFDLLGLPNAVASVAYGIAAAATAIGALIAWRTRAPLALRYAALLIATVLVDPHLYAYDLLLLVPAFLLLWDWILSQPERRIGDVFPTATLIPQRVRKWSFNTTFLWLVYICYLSPLFITLADLAGIQLSAPLLGLLGAVILGVLRADATRSGWEG